MLVLLATTILFVSSATVPGVRAATRFVIPSSAFLELHTTVMARDRVPVVVLVVWRYDSCHDVTPLQIKTSFERDLSISIIGYHQTERRRLFCDSNSSSNSNNSLAKIPVPLEWLDRSPRTVRVRLHGRDNTYVMTRRGYQVTITPRQVPNVRTARHSNNCPPNDTGAPTLTSILYPLDVARLVGNYPESTFVAVAQEQGLARADRVYAGLREGGNRCGFLVVVKGNIPSWRLLRGNPQSRYIGLAKIADTDLSNFRH
jgi:hypothetical protein